MTARRVPIMIVTLGLGVAGCGPSPSDRPPTIRYGEAACDSCRMIISEERFAAATLTASHEVRRFDDIGCLLASLRSGEPPPVHAWVHDHGTGQWLAAEAAWFMQSPELATPMGSGLAAFSTEAGARQAGGALQGRVVTWPELMAAR